MTPKTLRQERIDKFADLIVEFISTSPSIENVNGNEDILNKAIYDFACKLADAAPARTEKKTDEPQESYNPYAKKPEVDKVAEWLKMAQFPGAKKEIRVDAILSFLAACLHRTTTSKEWLEFAKWIDAKQQKDGQKVEVFTAWMMGQKNYDPQYWPIKKMQEFWPSAFVEKPKDATPATTNEGGFYV